MRATEMLTPLQRQALKHYEGGAFSELTTMQQVHEAGDGLLTFCVIEAGDADSSEEYEGMLARAVNQLRSLAAELLT